MKINKIACLRVLAQAEAAKELGNEELAEFVKDVKPNQNESLPTYDETMFRVKSLLWNAIMEVVAYHDIENVVLEDLEEIVDNYAKDFIDEVEDVLGLERVGPGEEKIPGEK